MMKLLSIFAVKMGKEGRTADFSHPESDSKIRYILKNRSCAQAFLPLLCAMLQQFIFCYVTFKSFLPCRCPEPVADMTMA